ncbi:MAG: DUF1127 domain-containing protein [Rhizobiaceae bacterium]|nr:DUF1127 domain-containing protein [Rhizobiaceae bacterium]
MTCAALCCPREKPPGLLARIGRFVRQAFERRQAINDIERLDDRALRDIGVERHDIAARIDAEMRLIDLRSRGTRP